MAAAVAACSATGPVDGSADRPTEPLRLSDGELVVLGRNLRARLGTGGGGTPSLPSRLVGDRGDRVVFVTAAASGETGRVFRAGAVGIAAAAAAAIERVKSAGVEHEWLRIDVVEERSTMTFPDASWAQEVGLYGLVLEPGEIELLPEEVVVERLVDRSGELSMRRWNEVRENRGVSPAHAAVDRATRFTVSSVFVDSNRVFPLYRGHRMSGPPTRVELLAAVDAGADYLRRAVGADGRFLYRYWPKNNRDRGGYNVLRHAGTAYSMFEVVGRTRSTAVLNAAERALDGLIEHFVEECPPPARGERCVVEKGYVKLGGNALAILALTKHHEVTGARRHLPLLQSLGRYLIALQQEDGEFRPHKQRARDGAADSHVSIYYPGEALLALMRMHRVDPSGPWLDAAERGARFLIEIRDADLPKDRLPHDHWLLYALDELYRARPRRLFLEHAMAIADTIVAAQRSEVPYRDWVGSFYTPPRSTPASTRTEGLIAAHRLAGDSGEQSRAREYYLAAERGVRYFLQHQIRPETALYLPAPERALGGVRRSYGSWEIRIDYVQHALSALLGLERLLPDDVTAPAGFSGHRDRSGPRAIAGR